jgi:YHS domain-containing protein
MERGPVCGMLVAPHQAAAPAEYAGKTYSLCAPGCKRAFQQDLKSYLQQSR